jgi:hypothetical protein
MNELRAKRDSKRPKHISLKGYMISVLNPLQVFPGPAVVVGHRQSSTKFFGCAMAVVLFLEQLTEQVMRLERRTFFHWRFQISP